VLDPYPDPRPARS